MLRTLLQVLPFFNDSEVVYLNADGTILSLTEKFAQKKGYSRTAVMGKSYSHLSYSAERNEEYYKELLQIAAKKGSIRYKVPATPKGKARQKEILLEAIKDESKQVIGYTVTL